MVNVRVFLLSDQQAFADITGDWNPIHVDPIYARRTVAGAPAVHGVHLLLWALDGVARECGDRRPTQIRAAFERFVLIGQTVSYAVTWRDDTHLVIAMESENVRRCTIDLIFQEISSGEPLVRSDWPIFAPGKDAIDRAVTEIDGLSGHVPLASGVQAVAKHFPRAASWLGAGTVASLGATTRLVGMVCPGLHSIFQSLRATLNTQKTGPEAGIFFTTGAVRHGLVNMNVAGAGLEGAVTAVMRAQHQQQPAMRDIAPLLSRDEFAGDTAVVIGASRGLGETTAKILAAGGAHVLATWSDGAGDAERVSNEIRAAGGHCTALRYRVGDAAAALGAMSVTPSHGYYFAAPTIARPTSVFFDAERLRDFERFFVSGFWEFADQMRAKCSHARLFYPSTIYLENWPKGLAEYAMAKAAGEILCSEINARCAPLTVVSSRLPRLPTDQTAGLYQTQVSDPLDVLLPLVRSVQRG